MHPDVLYPQMRHRLKIDLDRLLDPEFHQVWRAGGWKDGAGFDDVVEDIFDLGVEDTPTVGYTLATAEEVEAVSPAITALASLVERHRYEGFPAFEADASWPEFVRLVRAAQHAISRTESAQ